MTLCPCKAPALPNSKWCRLHLDLAAYGDEESIMRDIYDEQTDRVGRFRAQIQAATTRESLLAIGKAIAADNDATELEKNEVRALYAARWAVLR